MIIIIYIILKINILIFSVLIVNFIGNKILIFQIFYFELNTACWKSTMLPASFSTSCIEWLQADVSQSFQVEDLTNSLMITLQEIWTLLPTEQVPWRTFSNRN